MSRLIIPCKSVPKDLINARMGKECVFPKEDLFIWRRKDREREESMSCIQH